MGDIEEYLRQGDVLEINLEGERVAAKVTEVGESDQYPDRIRFKTERTDRWRMIPKDQVRERLIARQEDLDEYGIRDLRVQEAMLASQMVMLEDNFEESIRADWVEANYELRRSLYAVRKSLSAKGARTSNIKPHIGPSSDDGSQ